MARIALTIFTVLVVLVAAFYQLVLKSMLGVGRVIDPVGNTKCIPVPELKACEKIVLHQPTGALYLACSSPEGRTHWTPAIDHLNASGRSDSDDVAVYDPQTSHVTRLIVSGPPPPRGLSVHGMDVVPSSSNPSELYIYLVNHRVPLHGDPAEVGADSSIEVFKTMIGTSTMRHVRTFEDEKVIVTPNDVVGSSDGKSVFFTNDKAERVGLGRYLAFLGRADTSVGYCHSDEGCSIKISNMHSNNGIVKAKNNDTFYVASALLHKISVLERQSDNSLVLIDVIRTDRGMDNLSIDHAGNIWAAGLIDILKFLKQVLNPHNVRAPSSALRISRNTGLSSFYGEKYKVDKVFEDDGEVASASTSAAYDSERNRLFMHGLCSPHLTVCRL